MKTPPCSIARLLCSFGTAAVWSAASLAATPLFTLTDVGDPGIPDYLFPTNPKINNVGEVTYTIHSVFPDYTAFFYSGGTITAIPTLFDGMDLPGHDNLSNDINDAGYVVGASRINNSSDISHAFVSSGAASSTDISPFPHDDYSNAISVNNAGDVLGHKGFGLGISDYFVYSIPGGTVTDLTPLLPAGARALDLNNLGHILGTSGGTTFYYDGVTHLIPAITGNAVDMNDTGQIAGKDGDNVFLYSGGIVHTVGSHPDLLFVEALNNAGTVVGTFDSGVLVIPDPGFSDSSLRAFGSFGGGPLIDLNTRIDASLGWTLINATDINDVGQITGIGIDGEGRYRPYILTPIPPVPEPSTYGMIGAGFLAIVVLVRRRSRRAAA